MRYVVQAKDESKTIVRIDAVFAEEFLRTVHPSDGSVENAESQDIQDRIDAVETEKKQVAQREKQLQEKLAQQIDKRKKETDEAAALAGAQSSAQTLDQQVESLRHQAERVVKAPGGTLKSAPFQSATNVKSLEAGEEVVIVIVTPYWYGVETTEGQHGWMNRRQLEPCHESNKSLQKPTSWLLCIVLSAIPMMVLGARRKRVAAFPTSARFRNPKSS